MALLEVRRVALARPWTEIRGGGVDFPQVGFRCDQRAIDIEGWALGKDGEAIGAEVSSEGIVLERVRLNVVRKDLAVEFPGIPDAEHSGFRTTVSLLDSRATDLLVHAVLRDHRRVLIGTIGVETRWRQSPGGEKAPLVSVIIPCLDEAQGLRTAIESVVAQTYPDVEIVVVDGGSLERASEVVSGFPGVRCVRETNRGRGAARNRGIRETKGDYLAFLDANELLLPGAIERGLAAFREHPECAFVAGHRRLLSADGGVLVTPETACVERDAYEAFLRRDFVGTSAAVLYRRDLFASVGNFDTFETELADYDLFLRAARVFPFACHHGLIADSCVRESSAGADPIQRLKEARRILRSQASNVRRNAEHRAALRQGVIHLRSTTGRSVALLVRESLRSGSWKRALAGLKGIVAYDPKSLRWLWT